VRRVLYNLPRVIEAVACEQVVVVVEGEKDVDNLRKLNIVATCNPGGASKWNLDYNDSLRGSDIILVPDNDDAGYAHINQVGQALAGVATRLRVLLLPDLPDKGDTSDWIAAGGTAGQFWTLVEVAPEWVPPLDEAKPDDAAKAKAADAEQRLIDELARLSAEDYDRRRNEAADSLGIRRGTLDNARDRRRAEIDAERGPPPLFGHWVVEPWPDPVDGDALILSLVRRIRRHVIITEDQAITVALWILMAWVHQEAAIHSPILLATSAEANSGKTTLLNLVGFLVPRGMSCVGTSEASLFRSIEMWSPCVIVDEADTILIDNEPLRAVINSGYTRGSGVPRCIGDNNTPHLFPTFCPKALGMKGRKLPDTTLSRCVILEMRRKKRTERAEHFRHIDDANLAELRSQCMRWTIDTVEALKVAKPEMPAGFDNRAGDNWSLMLAIADQAGGDWPEKARQAALAVSKVIDAADTSTGVRLLADVKVMFDEADDDCMLSKSLVGKLTANEEGRWIEYSHGKPLTQNRLASLLGPFGIHSETVHPKVGPHGRGYKRAAFEDAWARYLSEKPSSPSSDGEMRF
jgi:putative DNA primase/helicase